MLGIVKNVKYLMGKYFKYFKCKSTSCMKTNV